MITKNSFATIILPRILESSEDGIVGHRSGNVDVE